MQQNPFNRPTNQPDSYKTLIVFRKSECVYDITFYFVSRFLERSHDRTVDQMQQAARSGKQNIVEGYSDAEGSTEIEHKLTVIAKKHLLNLPTPTPPLKIKNSIISSQYGKSQIPC